MAKCECSDPGCPVCKGECKNTATQCLVRVDMEDQTGTLMCDGCADDAFESGLFRGSVSLFIQATRKK